MVFSFQIRKILGDQNFSNAYYNIISLIFFLKNYNLAIAQKIGREILVYELIWDFQIKNKNPKKQLFLSQNVKWEE